MAGSLLPVWNQESWVISWFPVFLVTYFSRTNNCFEDWNYSFRVDRKHRCQFETFTCLFSDRHHGQNKSFSSQTESWISQSACLRHRNTAPHVAGRFQANTHVFVCIVTKIQSQSPEHGGVVVVIQTFATGLSSHFIKQAWSVFPIGWQNSEAINRHDSVLLSVLK